MIELHAADRYEITGRGQGASFTAGCLPEGVGHPRELLGRTILVDGQRHTVRGVEHWAIVCPREGRCTHPFGLLLSEGKTQQ